MLTAVGCFDRPIGWRHGGLHSGSTWYSTRGSATAATPDLFGSVFQQRTLHQHHHSRQQHQQHHYPPAAAAFASLLQQASSVVAPTAAVVPYFQQQSISDDVEKPIGCGAFGVVWCVCYTYIDHKTKEPFPHALYRAMRVSIKCGMEDGECIVSASRCTVTTTFAQHCTALCVVLHCMVRM